MIDRKINKLKKSVSIKINYENKAIYTTVSVTYVGQGQYQKLDPLWLKKVKRY